MKCSGGQKVGKSTYLNLANAARVNIAKEGVFPEIRNQHRIVVLLASPLTGMLYVNSFCHSQVS
jgi:hypothetical protein